MTDITETMTARQNLYGKFRDNAKISQLLKNVVVQGPTHFRLDWTQTEALEMICHKIARIVCGDPDYADSWDDIAGYALRVVEVLREEPDYNHGYENSQEDEGL
jgi:hypothetical protein